MYVEKGFGIFGIDAGAIEGMGFWHLLTTFSGRVGMVEEWQSC